MAPVNLTFNGNTADAQAAIAALERKYGSLENKISTLKKAGSGGGDTSSWSSGLDNVLGKYVSIGAVIGGVGAAVGGVMAKNEQLLEQLNQIAEKHPERETKFQIQSGMTREQAEALIPRMERSLNNTPSTNVAGEYELNTQIASSGFKKTDVESGAILDTILELKAATNDFGEGAGNVKELTQNLGMIVKASGSAAPSAAELKNVGSMAVSLFEATDIQAHDLKQIAPKIGVLGNYGLSTQESLGAYAAAGESLGYSKVDTGLTQAVTRLSTAAAFKERAEALETLGVKPSEVAMTPGGIGFMQAFDLLRSRSSKLDPAKRNEAFSKLFGEEGTPTASYLTSDAGSKHTKDMIEIAGDSTAFKRNVTRFRESRYASQQRSKNQDEFATMYLDKKTGGYSWAEADRDIDVIRKKALAGASNGYKGYKQLLTAGHWLEDLGTGLIRRTGLSPTESGMGRSKFIEDQVNAPVFPGNGPLSDRAADELAKNNELVAKNTEALEKLVESNGRGLDQDAPRSPRSSRSVNRNGNVE